ncbi:putative group protein [Podospora australis]|uniref:Group protein n=1 Tax=Podospora australis TaxID=1536484 RepID=A0AAN6WNC5_9PEZI|nr:putative group protein [Podospora australis]
MDLLTITTACVALLSAAGKTTILSQLQLVLELLRDDTAVINNNTIPKDVQTRTLSTIQSCSDVITKINDTMDKSEGRTGAVKWAAFTKGEVSGLRESLKTHRDTPSMALEVVTLLYEKATKEDTTAIRGDVQGIAKDTMKIPEILEELQQLRSIVAAIPSVTANQRLVIQQYLDSLTTCAETVCDEPVAVGSKSRPQSGGQHSYIVSAS